MGDTIEVIDGLDSDSTTGVNIFGICWWRNNRERKNKTNGGHMIDRILNWAVPLVCGSVVTYCVTWWRMQKKKNTALEDGVQCLLRAEILRNYKEYSRKGYCPNYAKEAESRTYKAYHALGGNDVATDKHEHIMALPDEIEKRE